MPVHARLAVLMAISGAAFSLMQAGLPPLEAVAVALLTAAGGVELGCRLTAPVAAVSVRVAVVVVVITAVITAVAAGYPAFECVAVVLLTAGCAVEIGRRVTGVPYRLPYRLPSWSPDPV